MPCTQLCAHTCSQSQVAWDGWRPTLPNAWPGDLKLLLALAWHAEPRLRCVGSCWLCHSWPNQVYLDVRLFGVVLYAGGLRVAVQPAGALLCSRRSLSLGCLASACFQARTLIPHPTSHHGPHPLPPPAPCAGPALPPCMLSYWS